MNDVPRDNNRLPARLHKLKVFESTEVFVPESGGRESVTELCTKGIDEQVNAWVDQTAALIVHTSPVSIQVHVDKNPASMAGIPENAEWALIEKRLISVVYTPAMERSEI